MTKPEFPDLNLLRTKSDGSNLNFVSEPKYLHGSSKYLGQYVDVVQSAELNQAVKSLIYKLKELYFIRKIKPQKGKYKKVNAAPKKRYIIGLKEVTKNLDSNKLNMVIIATNVEKVEGEYGLDEHLLHIKDECKR